MVLNYHFVLRAVRLSLVVLLVTGFVAAGCSKNKQQAANTNTAASENLNTNDAAATVSNSNEEGATNDAAAPGTNAAPVNSNKNSNASNSNTAKPPLPQLASTSLLLATQNDSAQTGTAVITDIGNGKTRVTIRISNPPQNGVQPAHIHSSLCETIGGVLHSLNNVVGGYSETVLLVPYATIMTQTPFSINVHKSSSDLATSVACGDKLM